MNKWDEDELYAIRGVFNWADMDGDESLSREDLKLAMGMVEDSVIEKLFFRLKGSKSSLEALISFEEFSSNIMEVPELIVKFRQDCSGKSDSERMSYSEYKCDHDSINYKDSLHQEDPLDFLKQPLSMTMALLQPLINSSVPEETEVEGMLTNIEILVDMLNSKTTQDKLNTNHIKPLVYITNNMLTIIKHLYEFQETARLSLKTELREAKIAFDSLNLNHVHLKDQNETLLSELENLEKNKHISEIELNNILSQRNILQRNIEQLEEKTQIELFTKQRMIENREKELKEMKKELRDQQSKQQLQEIRAAPGLLSDEKIRQVKIKKCSSRMTFEPEDFKPKKNDSEKKVVYLTAQIQSMDLTIKNLNKNIEEFNKENKKLHDALQNARQDIHELSMRNEELKALNQNCFEERTSIRTNTINFLDELNDLGFCERNTFTNFNKEILSENNTIPAQKEQPVLTIAKQLSIDIQEALKTEVYRRLGTDSPLEVSIESTIKEVVDTQLSTPASLNVQVIKQVGVLIEDALRSKLDLNVDKQLGLSIHSIIQQQVSAGVQNQLDVEVLPFESKHDICVQDKLGPPQNTAIMVKKSIQCHLLTDCHLDHVLKDDSSRDSCGCSIF